MLDFLVLCGFGAATMAAASTGAIYKPGRWYEGLAKPPWTPPNWLFPVAWMILYVLIIISGWRVAMRLAEGACTGAECTLGAAGLAFWAAQMTLNAVWSPLFFGIRRPDAALICVSFLWLAVLATGVLFAMIDPLSGALLIPYLIWVTIAAALNRSVLRRNGSEKWGLPDAA